MAISSISTTSQFARTLITHGYDHDTPLSTFLSHLDLYDITTDNINDIITLLLVSKSKKISEIIVKIGINKSITICDELHATQQIHHILHTRITNTSMSNDIINGHSKRILTECSRGYRLLCKNHRIANCDSLQNALLNGVYLTTYKFYTKLCKKSTYRVINSQYHDNNVVKSAFADVSTVILCDAYNKIYIKTINIDDDHCDKIQIVPQPDELKLFGKFEKMIAKNNIMLPEYPMPDSLIEVRIPCEDEYLKYSIVRKSIANRDITLSLCNNIRVLNASNNPIITTCKPFAVSLRILYADTKCGICDAGLMLCKRIKLLDASDNPRITTCDPFATSLVKLFARDRCRINDECIYLCVRLKFLCAANNPRITHGSFVKRPQKYNANSVE